MIYILKGRDCKSGLKNKNKLQAVYKKSTLNININRLKVKRWKKIYHVNINKKTGVALFQTEQISE